MIDKPRIYRHIETELRHRTEGDSATIEGYANKFNTYSDNLGGFVEEVLPGAFKESIATKAGDDKRDVRGTYNHTDTLARQKDGSLKVGEDDVGLHFEIQLNMRITSDRDLYEKIDIGRVNGASFGFAMLDWEWSHTAQDFPLLRQKAVELFDVGPVDFPAYSDTDAETRMMLYRSFAEQAGCDDIACFVDTAATTYADTRKFNLSNLLEVEAQPVAATPLLDAARERHAQLEAR